MADVDKSLPNVRQNITVPSDEEMVDVQTAIQETIVPRLQKTKTVRLTLILNQGHKLQKMQIITMLT
jgi:hypothetical protein